MYLGLDMIWNERILQLIVESDSKVIINMVTFNYKFSETISTVVNVVTIF